MKILKYEKKKNGMYQVFLENGNNVDIHEEIILKYGLLIKKNTTDSELEKMLDENKIYIGYNLAIKYLSKKMRTKKEIIDYLSKNNIDNNSIVKIIELLNKDNYLDEKTYISSYINDRILLSYDGPRKIKDKLMSLGLKENYIDEGLTIFNSKISREKIGKIAEKMIKTNKSKSSFILKNKIINYIYNLGYYKDDIMSIIDNIKFKNDLDIAKKEYEKIYKRLSKKYSGSDLEYRVKQKMYALGFNNFSE
ncbi:MAG: RecX family transcriptional regulator [Bacilli bacterium]|nr:RecX family transcriptional regulator [Bacilli bacterium]